MTTPLSPDSPARLHCIQLLRRYQGLVEHAREHLKPNFAITLLLEDTTIPTELRTLLTDIVAEWAAQDARLAALAKQYAKTRAGALSQE